MYLVSDAWDLSSSNGKMRKTEIKTTLINMKMTLNNYSSKNVIILSIAFEGPTKISKVQEIFNSLVS